MRNSVHVPLVCRQLDDAPLRTLKILSQSTDSLNKMGKVNESTESLTDEGKRPVSVSVQVLRIVRFFIKHWKLRSLGTIS